MEHSKWDYAVASRKRIEELTDRFDFHMSKVILGFNSKYKTLLIPLNLHQLLTCVSYFEREPSIHG
jgi:hypothetical protein